MGSQSMKQFFDYCTAKVFGGPTRSRLSRPAADRPATASRRRLKWAFAGLAMMGLSQPADAQIVTAAPPPPGMGSPMMGGPMMGGGPTMAPPQMQNISSSLPADFTGAPVYDGGPPPVADPAYGNPMGGSPSYDSGCPPVYGPMLGRIYESPGTLFFRAEAFMLRRSQPLPTRPLVVDGTGTTRLATGDLHFRNEVGQKFDIGYEFNECATIAFTFWEVQDWQPTNGVVSANNDLTLPGAVTMGGQPANFINANSIQATYQTMIKNYEINYTNATWFDRVSLLGGFRYVDMIDRLALVSTRVAGAPNQVGTSDYIVRVTDALLGGQIGAVIHYDIDLWRFEFTGKSGLYNNQAQFNKFLGDNNNQVVVNAQAAPANLATLAAINEMNLSFTRRLSNHLAVRAGYNVMWITNTALASDQLDYSLNQTASGTVLGGGDLFLYGVNVGADLRF